MQKGDLIKYKEKLGKLSEKEQQMRNLYLGNIAKGNIQGPGLEYASISKPWLASEKCIVDLPDANMSAYDYIYVINKDHLGEVAFEYDPIPGYESTKITYRDFFEEIDKN